MRLSLPIACVASLFVVGCGLKTTAPTTGAAPKANAGTQSVGYAYDAFIVAQTTYLTYLNGSPDKATVARIKPLYDSANSALGAYALAVASGQGITNATTALQAATAALSAALLPLQQPGA